MNFLTQKEGVSKLPHYNCIIVYAFSLTTIKWKLLVG